MSSSSRTVRADVLRTPLERFANLPDFDYEPRYIDDLRGYEGLRMAYVESGPADASTVFLCLHGEPTWSFLYRKMAREFAAVGHRVVMPDFFGFGRSDKPVDDRVYTFEFHRTSVLRLIESLELRNIVLVVQDWGGLIGLTLPMAAPERIHALLIMNTTLACGEGPASEGFAQWRQFMSTQADPDVGALMTRAVDGLTQPEADAYDAPFPDARFKAGVRRFPAIVPTEPHMPGADVSRAAREWLRNSWSGPVMMAVGRQDPVLGIPVMRKLRDEVFPYADLHEIERGGHFVQEHAAHIAREACEQLATSGQMTSRC